MAKPIELTHTPHTPQEKLETATLDSAQALQESLVLLRELHEHGVLELLIKLVRGGQGLAEGTLDTLDTHPQVLLGLRSLFKLAKALGHLEPADLQQLTLGLGSAARQGALSAARGERVTPLDLPRVLLDPDVQLALGTVFGLLRGMGQGLGQASAGHPEEG